MDKFITENIEHKSRIKVVIGDIGLVETGRALTQTALESFGTIDVLINNAGIFIPKPFLEETEASLDQYYAVTLHNGELLYRGAVGKELTVEQGQKAAELCALNLLSQIDQALAG